MSVAVAGHLGTFRDVIALTKPRITATVVFTTAGGMWLAPGAISLVKAILMLLTTVTVVASANSLNCWLERDSDRLMTRTMLRPLPDRRLNPNVALFLGIALGLISVPTLTFGVNPVTGILGAIALLSYVLIYTPMKRTSSTALLVGAVPGALPPLMGWTAVTGTLSMSDAPGVVLFAILFFWQIPHFLAISMFREADYERAGLKTVPSEHGAAYSHRLAFIYTGLLLVSSLLLYVFQAAGIVYLIGAGVLGLGFLAVVLRGIRLGTGGARSTFGASLVYLVGLFVVIAVDVALR